MKVVDSISEEQMKCLEAVQRINNEMHDKLGWRDHNVLLSISICSFHFGVTLDINNEKFHCEIHLYNSADDDRIYYEKSDKYEEWYSYLKRKFRDVKSTITGIKL